MSKFFRTLFLENIQQKLLAIVAAVLIWLVIDHSISTTKTFTNVPVRVVNLAADQTIRGLMPNGILDRKLTLTLTGTKAIIDQIEPGDFEVVIDAFGKPEEWIVQISKRNLVSLNPDIDLIHNITALSQSEFVLKLSKLLTDKIPIHIAAPRGEPPEGYQYLDVWPKKFMHVVSGPEEDVKELQAKGIELTFDLGEISKEDLDNAAGEHSLATDEVSFYVPESWKKVQIPFLHDIKQEINAPEVRSLRIDFLKKELMALDRDITCTVFYPLSNRASVNPETHPLKPTDSLLEQNGLFILKKPLYVNNVSRLFLDIVKDRLELVIVAQAKEKNQPLAFALDFVDSKALEDAYVLQFRGLSQKEQFFRHRFRTYMRKMKLYENPEHPFELNAHLESNAIRIHEDN